MLGITIYYFLLQKLIESQEKLPGEEIIKKIHNESFVQLCTRFFFFFNHRGKCWMHPSYIVSGFFETECSECVCLKETEDINALIFSNHYIYSHSKKQPHL